MAPNVMKANKIVAALGALGQETRLELFRLLVQKGPEGLPAGRIAEKLGVPPSSLTFHLKHLTHTGLITQRRLSRQLIYAADYEMMNAVMSYLTENCCGAGTICAPQCNPAAAAPKGRKRSAA